MEHTPLPSYYPTGVSLENAQFIVTACNSYYVMREALEELLRTYPMIFRDGVAVSSTGGGSHNRNGESYIELQRSAVEKARKALEQSKGE